MQEAWRKHDNLVEIDEFKKYLQYSNYSNNFTGEMSVNMTATLRWDIRLLKFVLD